MPHSCITRQFVDIKSKFFQFCNRNDVKVNIMPFRTLSSIEFQGSCSRDLNLGSLKIVSLESIINSLSVDGVFQLSNRKNVKVNIMHFRILCSIEFQGHLLQKLECITV